MRARRPCLPEASIHEPNVAQPRPHPSSTSYCSPTKRYRRQLGQSAYAKRDPPHPFAQLPIHNSKFPSPAYLFLSHFPIPHYPLLTPTFKVPNHTLNSK
ncbi:unnamed protein product [Protopolystoma xenopodis]|uniref:Uncharacterized protein n=1 Tax=Protopolystoma xenopodis TaxID=117903 RepID=A0A3S5BMA6_9PLAT|nr:unnamed protein product [Protopolystoma xenopodis]